MSPCVAARRRRCVFGGLLVVHARVLNRAERARRAQRLYERGLARLDGRWAGTGLDGARFLDDHRTRAIWICSGAARCSS